MPKCSFCEKLVKPGYGRIFVNSAGRIFNFCSSKCRRNWRLGREPQKVNWVRKKKKIK